MRCAVYRWPFAAASFLWLAACVNPPPSAMPWSRISVIRAEHENLVGERVRWGGIVASIRRGEQETCFEVLSRPLARNGEPRDTTQGGDRFVACAPGVYPSSLYEGEQLTVVGTLQKPIAEQSGEVTHRYPRVAAEELHFWPAHESDSTRLTRDWPPSWEPWQPGTDGYWW